MLDNVEGEALMNISSCLKSSSGINNNNIHINQCNIGSMENPEHFLRLSSKFIVQMKMRRTEVSKKRQLLLLSIENCKIRIQSKIFTLLLSTGIERSTSRRQLLVHVHADDKEGTNALFKLHEPEEMHVFT